MSLELAYSKPQGLTAKTFSSDMVLLGDYNITTSDFCQLVMYVLTNTNLEPNDPRYDLVETIKKLKITDGFPSFIRGKDSFGLRPAMTGEHRFEVGT